MLLFLLAQAAGPVTASAPGSIATPFQVSVTQLPDDSFFVKVTAVATVLTALPAFAAVFISWFWNKQMFEESRASNAQTRRDVQLDRESGWKPHLAFDHPPIADAAGQPVVGVTNIGKGPALQCRYVARLSTTPPTPPRYFRAPRFAVGAESELRQPRFVEELNKPEDADSLKLAKRAFDQLPSDVTEVILCSDAFGNRWRFVRGRALPDGPEKDGSSPAARSARAAALWSQGWEGTGQSRTAQPPTGKPRWINDVRDKERRAAEEALSRNRRRDAWAVYREYQARFDDFGRVRGILKSAAGGPGTASLAPPEENLIRVFGNWAETVAVRVERGDLDRNALADTGLIEHLITFRSELSADARAVAILKDWPYLAALHG
jgi:hypothetical protein